MNLSCTLFLSALTMSTLLPVAWADNPSPFPLEKLENKKGSLTTQVNPGAEEAKSRKELKEKEEILSEVELALRNPDIDDLERVTLNDQRIKVVREILHLEDQIAYRFELPKQLEKEEREEAKKEIQKKFLALSKKLVDFETKAVEALKDRISDLRDDLSKDDEAFVEYRRIHPNYRLISTLENQIETHYIEISKVEKFRNSLIRK